MTISVYRITNPADADVLTDLAEEFHRKVPSTRYTLAWTVASLPTAIQRTADTFVLAAYDEHRGYLGYLWAQLNAAGELYIFQTMSKTIAAGRALEHELEQISARFGVQSWNALVPLRPGDLAVVFGQIPWVHALCETHKFFPEFLWITRKVKRH